MMDGRPAGLPLHEVRALSRSLAAARDEQVIRVVEMVDALDRRDAADGILAPLRPRLAQMRPARPLRFARLLFMPLDSVIVPAAGWRPGSATVPRTALGPLAAAVRSALGPAARDIDAAIAGCSAGDRRIVGLTGAGLWPRAGAVLAAAPALDGWAATGLPPAAAPDICRAAGAVLLAAVHLRRLAAEAAIGVRLEPEPLHAILAGPAQSGSEALAMAVAVLLAMLPQAAALLPRGASVIGPDGNALMRVAAGQAAEVLLGRLEAQGGSGTLAAANCLDEASAEVGRTVTLLDELEGSGPPPRRQRLAAIRGQLARICKERFSGAIERGLAAPLRAMARSPDPADLVDMEATARGLRQLEQASRRLGGSAHYEALLHDAATAVRTSGGALSLCDKARLVEILTNSDEAEAVLDGLAPDCPGQQDPAPPPRVAG